MAFSMEGFDELVDTTFVVGAASLTVAGASTWVVPEAFTVFAGLTATSGTITRRSPSASARRRMRSAWASSMDAEGLEAPMPSFWASASNSLLVKPSSLESSCTRIFFCAKTFPCFACPHYCGHSLLFFHNYWFFKPRLSTRSLSTAISTSPSDARSARAT